MNALVTASPTNRYDLAGLSNDALLAGARRLVAGANHALAALLAHLAEVETRGIHRARACPSLYTYCVYELRLSEDAAFRRAKAARLCRKFPALYDAVESGELHLTGLLMLGPHLTDENLAGTLARAKHRTKREIARLVREIDPLPAVPARIEPLGPELASPRNPTWEEFAGSFNPVRELPPGERPADWLDPATDVRDAPPEGASDMDGLRDEAGAAALARPQRYKVQFTATQEYVELLERARDLLSHTLPQRSIEEVQLRALRELVAKLEKKKYAATDKPRQRGAQRQPAPHDDEPRQRDAQRQPAPHNDEPRQGGASAPQGESAVPRRRDAQRQPAPHNDEPRQGGASAPQRESAVPRRRDNNPRTGAPANQRDAQRDVDAPRRRDAQHEVDAPRRRDTIPATVRRAVHERAGLRCTYVDPRGQRCRETAYLELHHEVPFARGGADTVGNLSLRCRAHNALAAEDDFGRELVRQRKPMAPDG